VNWILILSIVWFVLWNLTLTCVFIMRLGSEGDMPEAGTPKKRVDDNFEEETKKRKFSSHTE